MAFAGTFSGASSGEDASVAQMFAAPTPGAGAASGFGGAPANQTLDEPVIDTVLRDLKRVAENVRLVTMPMSGRNDSKQALKNWDLWGPLFFVMLLGSALSWGSSEPSQVFVMVFLIVSLGAVVLTLNVLLLGGNIMFFQSLCLLGYCLFPLSVSSLICVWIDMKIVRSILLLLGIAWASWSAIPFVSSSVPDNRKVLAVYPLMLLYVCIGWLALVRS